MENKYNYKLETHLNQICESNDEYKNLCSSWELSKKTYKQILRNVSINYPHYSLHDDSHSESIITNIEMLLGKERIERLSPTNTWLILNCAYLHDFGMALLYSKIEDEWKSNEFQDFLKKSEESYDINLSEACKYINNFKNNMNNVENTWPLEIRKHVTEIIASYFRGKHSLLTKEYLSQLNEWELDLTQNGLIHKRLVSIISEISFMHTQSFEDILKLDYISNGYNSDYIHPRFIAELIRLGDVLDLDNGRFNEYTEKVTGYMAQTSRNHKEKHQSVRHVLITPENIEVRYDCSSSEVYREARRWIEYIESEIKNVTMSWSDIIPTEIGWYPPKLNKKELLLNGKLDEHNLSNLKFEIAQEKAFHILKGSNIYSDELTFIREFIQNALDATKIQLFRNLKEGIYDLWINEDEVKKEIRNLTPFDIDSRIYANYKIEVELEPKGENDIKLIIRDRGTGISIEDLKNMCNVGSSYDFRKKYKQEAKEMPSWLRPTGGFGIGIQAAFLVTDEIKAFTKSDSDGVLEIDFTSPKKESYINVKSSSKKIKRGTEFHIEFTGSKYYKYSLGGKTSDHIDNNYDIFSQHNITKYRVEDYINENIGETIFPLEVKDTVENTKNIYKESMMRDIEKSFKQHKDEDKKYIYSIAPDLSEIYIWDKEHSIYIESGEHNENLVIEPRALTGILFKGCYVNRESMNLYNWMKVDIYGFDTKKSLKIDRSKLTKAGINKLREILKEVEQFYFEKTMDKLINISKEEITPPIGLNLYRYMLKYSVLNKLGSAQKEIYKKILNDDNEIDLVSVLERNQDGMYEYKSVRFIVLIEKYPKLACLNIGSFTKGHENYNFESMQEYINKKNTLIDEETIIIDPILISILNKFGNDKIKYMKIDDKDVFIYLKNEFTFDNKKELDKFYVDMDEDTKKYFIKLLVLRNLPRNNIYSGRQTNRLEIPSIQGYEDLGVYGYENHNSKIIVISPMLLKDGENISNFKSKEAFIDSIIKRDDYKKLVEHVSECRVSTNEISIEKISEKYQALIGEYFDIINI